MQKSAAISAGTKLAQRDDRAQILNNMIGAGAEVFARGLDKSAEFEADTIGVVLAARAGYSPYGLVDVLQKLAMRGANDESLALLFKTHPPARRPPVAAGRAARAARGRAAVRHGAANQDRRRGSRRAPRRAACARIRRESVAGRARARGAACAKSARYRSHANPARHFRALAWKQ